MTPQDIFINGVGLFLLFVLSILVSTLIIRRGIPNLKSDKSAKDNQGTTYTDWSVTSAGHIEYGACFQTEPPTPAQQDDLPPDSSSTNILDLKATGFWIGVCETLLIFVLVGVGQYSALAIIIGAKEFVQKEKIQANPSWYLLGTLANLTVSVFFAVLGRIFFIDYMGG